MYQDCLASPHQQMLEIVFASQSSVISFSFWTGRTLALPCEALLLNFSGACWWCVVWPHLLTARAQRERGCTGQPRGGDGRGQQLKHVAERGVAQAAPPDCQLRHSVTASAQHCSEYVTSQAKCYMCANRGSISGAFGSDLHVKRIGAEITMPKANAESVL